MLSTAPSTVTCPGVQRQPFGTVQAEFEIDTYTNLWETAAGAIGVLTFYLSLPFSNESYFFLKEKPLVSTSTWTTLNNLDES